MSSPRGLYRELIWGSAGQNFGDLRAPIGINLHLKKCESEYVSLFVKINQKSPP